MIRHRHVYIAVFVSFLIAMAGCQDFAAQTKLWEQGCHVTIDGTMSAGITGVSGQASVHKECWPDGQDHAAPAS